MPQGGCEKKEFDLSDGKKGRESMQTPTSLLSIEREKENYVMGRREERMRMKKATTWKRIAAGFSFYEHTTSNAHIISLSSPSA